MTAAAWRRAKLPPLAAALAIACLALVAWTASARADGEIPPLGTSTSGGETSTIPDAGSAGPSGGATDPGEGSGTGGATQDPVASEPTPSDTAPPQQQPSEPPPDQTNAVTPIGGGGDRSDDRPLGTSDTSNSHEGGPRGNGSSAGSTAPVTTLGTPVHDPSGLIPEGDLSLPPMTQFTVVPASPSTGGSGPGAGLASGGVRIGCLTLCPGGTRLAAAMRLALSREARSAVREARARANGTAAKATAPSLFGNAGGGAVGLFNLLGGGGSGAAIVFIGFLAVLMGLFALPRDWSDRLRLPAATWRPSAYIAPIELPG